jgi:hypothetical protein
VGLGELTYLDRIADAIAEELPAEAKTQDGARELLLLYALLAVTRGVRVSKRNVHDAWVTWQLLRGQNHASNVPFPELADAVQAEDEPYRKAIIRAARKFNL